MIHLAAGRANSAPAKIRIELSIFLFLFVLLKNEGENEFGCMACVGVKGSERLGMTGKRRSGAGGAGELGIQLWDSTEKTTLSCPRSRFRVTHIGKKPPVQDGPLPTGSRQPSTEELERSSERLQRELALNGTVPTGGLQNGAIQTGTQSGKSAEQSLSASPAANTAASSGTRESRRAGLGTGPVGSSPAGSLRDAGSAPGSSSRQRRLMSLPALGASSPNIPGQLAREGAGICLEEIGLESADEVSDIHGSLSLQEQADELGRDDSSRNQPGGEDRRQQVCSSSSWSPCGPLAWRGIAFSHPFSSA